MGTASIDTQVRRRHAPGGRGCEDTMFGDDVMGRLADGRSLPSVVTVERPRTQYADAGDVTIAYCRSGSGPIDVVVMPPFATHLELMWEPPFNGRFFDRFARFARVAQIDKRGVGLSDRMSEPATLEERMDDLRAVMDAEESNVLPSSASPTAHPCLPSSPQHTPSECRRWCCGREAQPHPPARRTARRCCRGSRTRGVRARSCPRSFE